MLGSCLSGDNLMNKRIVSVHDDGIREVAIGDSESWTRYLIVPRNVMLNHLRYLRKRGRRLDSIEWHELLPYRYLDYSHYGGPGGSFCRGSVLLKRTRRFYTIVSSGGLDI